MFCQVPVAEGKKEAESDDHGSVVCDGFFTCTLCIHRVQYYWWDSRHMI